MTVIFAFLLSRLESAASEVGELGVGDADGKGAGLPLLDVEEHAVVRVVLTCCEPVEVLLRQPDA